MFHLPEEWQVSLIKPEPREALNNPVNEIVKALNDLGAEFNAGQDRKKAAVAINDKTRPVPHNLLLPPLVHWLNERGFKREDITFIIASGTHTPMLPAEHHLIVPKEIDEQFRIISHDADREDSLVNLGVTSSGTPCTINRIFAEADLKIVVGNIEPHQYMGWSGGVKSAVIGLGGAESIRTNHAMLSLKGASPCRYDDNPVRQDVEESGRLIAVHLALNVVMNDKKEIVSVFAGNPVSVMKRGINEALSLFTAAVSSRSDLVITSPGGYPKDINLYQTQKALRHASAAAKPGAPMILAGCCIEGVGSGPYEAWMNDKTSHEEVRNTFNQEEFKLGPHKAMLFAADAMGRDVYLVSDLPRETVKKMLLKPAASVQDAIDEIRETWREKQQSSRKRPIRAAILPYGYSTVPIISA